MTRALNIQKWSVYVLCGLLPIWLLDAYILSRYPVGGLIPQLLPLTVVCVAVFEGGYAGAGFGLGTGLLWTLVYPGTQSIRILLLCLLGMLVGILAQYALQQSFPGYLLCCAIVCGALNAWMVGVNLLFHSAPFPVLLGVGIGETLLTLFWSPLVFVLFHRIFKKVGGTRLA